MSPFSGFPRSGPRNRLQLAVWEWRARERGDVRNAVRLRVQIIDGAFTELGRRNALHRAIRAYAECGRPDVMYSLVRDALATFATRRAARLNDVRTSVRWTIDRVEDQAVRDEARRALNDWYEHVTESAARAAEAPAAPRKRESDAAKVRVLLDALAAVNSPAAAEVIGEELVAAHDRDPRVGATMLTWTDEHVERLADRPHSVAVLGYVLDHVASRSQSAAQPRLVAALQERLSTVFARSLPDPSALER